jgi:Domain of unknown function (DUF5615)
VKALLHEQLSPQIAVLLRQVGLDVEAVADRPDLVGRSDMVIFEVAGRDDRTVITNNIKDFRPLAAQWLAQGRVHGGLILLHSARTRTRAAPRCWPTGSPASCGTTPMAWPAANAGSARCPASDSARPRHAGSREAMSAAPHADDIET